MLLLKNKVADIRDSDRILQWIRTILAEVSANETVDGEGLLSACGRECAGSSALMAGAVAVRKELPPNADPEMLFRMFRERYYNRNDFEKAGNRITLIFDSCTCPLVHAGIDDPFLCRCTVGFTRALFETLFQRPVTVTLHSSILGGDEVCRQEIMITGD